MNRRQFFVLFLCNLIPWWVGSGLVSVLPLYAGHLGASPTVTGNYLSFLFLALAAGTLMGGWIAPKMRQFRRLLMVLAASSAVAILLMGQVTTIWQLILLTVAAWFSAGITGSLVMILVGEHAAEGKRGVAFGLLAMTTSLGGLLGGVTGFIVDNWGYTWLFGLAGFVWLLQILVASFLNNPPRISRPQPVPVAERAQSADQSALFAMPFLLLLAGALLVSIAGFAGFLGRTLAMEANSFSIAAITLIAALGSGLGLVINPLLGRLSDRGRRRTILGALYLAGALALGITIYARTTTDFVVVAVLLAFGAAERGISVALVSDSVPGPLLSRSLAIFDSVKWMGAVVGLAGTGYAIEQIGLTHALLWSMLLPVFATLMLFFMRAAGAHAGDSTPAQLDSPWPAPVQHEGMSAQ